MSLPSNALNLHNNALIVIILSLPLSLHLITDHLSLTCPFSCSVTQFFDRARGFLAMVLRFLLATFHLFFYFLTALLVNLMHPFGALLPRIIRKTIIKDLLFITQYPYNVAHIGQLPTENIMTSRLNEDEIMRRKIIGTRIKIARKNAGFAEVKDIVAKHFPKVGKSMFYQWESGRRMPDDKTLQKVSKHCRVNFDWLKTGKSNMLDGIKVRLNEAMKKEALAGYEMLALHLFEKSPEEMQAHLEKTLSQYAKSLRLTHLSPEVDHYPSMINTALLEEILRVLIERKTPSKSLDTKLIVSMSAKIYSKILEATDDQLIQLKMVKPVVAACL